MRTGYIYGPGENTGTGLDGVLRGSRAPSPTMTALALDYVHELDVGHTLSLLARQPHWPLQLNVGTGRTASLAELFHVLDLPPVAPPAAVSALPMAFDGHQLLADWVDHAWITLEVGIPA